MNPVVHFELPADDKKRMVDFYTQAFGWSAQMLGPEMGEYVVVTTTPIDEKTKRPATPGAINGGLYQRDPAKGAQYPSIVISVDDIKESIEKVTKAGGKVNTEPMDIPGVGLFVSITDTEGNNIAMLQPKMM